MTDLGLSPEEEKELSVGLLREWWLTATQAFVDQAGSEVALKYLRPHWRNFATVGGNIHLKSNHHTENSLQDVVRGVFLWTDMVKEAGMLIKLGQQGAIIRARGCTTRGACREACMGVCQYASESFFEEMLRLEGLSPDFEINLIKSLSFGDDSCEWHFTRKGENLEESSLEEVAPLSFSDEEQLFWQLAIHGEEWVFSTKAFSEWAGPEKASQALRPYMRLSGLSVGNFLAETIGLSSIDQATLANMVAMICKAHGKKAAPLSDHAAEQVIIECPFSDSPKEICEQYEAFFNGICEVINPEYEFAYDRMMTRGDNSCHWIIRKKGENQRAVEVSKAEDEAIKTLRLRFAKGEISKEEYLEAKKILEG